MCGMKNENHEDLKMSNGDVVSRRAFLRLSTIGGTLMAAGGCRTTLFTGAASDYDPNLTVFLSDIHVRGGESYQLEHFKRVVAEILKMSPLPKRAVVFGDLAYLFGRKEDYVTLAPYLKQLTDAGISVTIGMGNHDRRSAFLEVHPEYARSTKVPGRIVSVVDIGPADILMLDSLAGSDDRGNSNSGPVPGTLDAAQQEWLLAELPKWKRPVFVCAHHPVFELTVGGKPLSELLYNSPAFAGYINGHNHRWYAEWSFRNYSQRKLLCYLGLPSTGHWGDIGYTLFRTTPRDAVANLVQHDFFFPNPLKEGEPRPEMWDAIVEKNRGAHYRFVLPNI